MRPHFNIRRLQVFEVLARIGSLSGAARELGITESAISHQISKLSEEIGEDLFAKQGRRIVLTDRGAEVAETLHTAFSQINHSLFSVGEFGRPVVRLALCSCFARGWLIPRFEDLVSALPNIDLQLCMYALYPELTDKAADAFITIRPKETGFWYMRVETETLIAVGRPGLLQQRDAVPLITTEVERDRVGIDWQKYFAQNDDNAIIRHDGQWLLCSHHVLALDMAKNGFGIALVPDFLAADAIEKAEVERIGSGSIPTREDYYLCVKQTRVKERGLYELIKWFRAEKGAASHLQSPALANV